MSRVTKIYERVNPKDFEIAPEMIAEIEGIPVERIRGIVKKDYVILVHQWHLPSLYVSYRKLSQWLQKLVKSIRQCRTIEEILHWEWLLKQEYKRFKYPKEWMQQLDATLQQQRWQVVLELDADITGQYPANIHNPTPCPTVLQLTHSRNCYTMLECMKFF